MNTTKPDKFTLKSKKLATWFIPGLALLLFFGYILLSFNNRFHSDDFRFFSFVRDNGIWKAFLNMYFSWETIYNTLVLFFLLKWINIVPPYIYNLSIFFINIYCFYLLLKSIFSYYVIQINSKKALLISVLVIGITYFSCRAMGNATYWVTGQIVYCLFLSYLFLGLHFWIRQKFFLASLCMFLFAHSRLNYDVIFMGLYASFFVYSWYSRRKIIFRWKSQIPFLFFLLGLITYLLIPGNYKRAATIHTADPAFHLNAFIIMKGWVTAFRHLAGNILLNWKQLIVLPTGVLLSFYIGKNARLQEIITPRLLLYCSLAFIISYIGQSTIIFIAIKTPVGYGRIFFFLELMLFILMLLYGMYIGIRLASYLAPELTTALILILSVGLLFSIGFDYYKNYKITSVFAKAYDKRIQLIVEMKRASRQENLYLTSLPYSGVFEFPDLSPELESDDSIPEINDTYIRYYQLPFKIYLAK